MWRSLIAVSRGLEPPSYLEVALVCYVLLALFGLLMLDPRRGEYVLGLALLALGFIAFWCASPHGAAWVSNWLGNPDSVLRGAPTFSIVFLFSLALGWVVLAGSLGAWLRGVGLYLAAGSIFAVLHSILVAELPAPLLPVYGLFWPHLVLSAVGVFGWTYTGSS